MAIYKFLTGRIVLLLFAFSLILLGTSRSLAKNSSSQNLSTKIIHDGDFELENWAESAFLVGDTDTMTEQRPVMANPDHTARYTTDTFQPIELGEFFEIQTYHLFHEVYDPAIDGPIEEIEYYEINKLESVSPLHQSQAVYGFMIIEQDGIIYHGPEFRIDYLDWLAESQTDMNATFFYDGENFIEGFHPDFSADGSPIRFGYGRSQTRAPWFQHIPADVVLIYEHAIDNWTITINPDVDPKNEPPVANDDMYVVDMRTGYTENVFNVLENDFDPDGDNLTVTISQPAFFGEAAVTPVDQMISYTRSLLDNASLFPDEFRYQISDGQFTDEAIVTVIIDCACALHCTSEQAARMDGTNLLDLDMIRRLRDGVMRQTLHGNRYIDMYYESTPEIARILIVSHTHLGTEAVNIAQIWQDNFASLADGDGTAVITQAQVDALDLFLTNLSNVASADLQQIIGDERVRIGMLDNYVGLTMEEAKGLVLGDEVIYLPLVINQ